MRRSFHSGLLVLTLLAGAGMLSAAPRSKPSGRIAGEVIGEDGKPVAGARVIFQAADGTHPHAARADGKGRFRISLRPGLYDLRAQENRQWSEWEHNVLVRSGRATNLTLRLTLKKPPDAPPRGGKPAQPSNLPSNQSRATGLPGRPGLVLVGAVRRRASLDRVLQPGYRKN